MLHLLTIITWSLFLRIAAKISSDDENEEEEEDEVLPGTSRLLADRVLKLPGETIDIKTMGQANKEKPAPVSHTVTSDWFLHGGGGGRRSKGTQTRGPPSKFWYRVILISALRHYMNGSETCMVVNVHISPHIKLCVTP